MKATRPQKAKAKPEHVAALKALAHPARLRAFLFVVRSGREVPAGSIQKAVGIPAPTLSRHLDVLRRAGLVKSRRSARFVFYDAQRGALRDVVSLLSACL